MKSAIAVQLNGTFRWLFSGVTLVQKLLVDLKLTPCILHSYRTRFTVVCFIGSTK
ncbi:uncharacterized protein METZ01_LOCUS211010 [marine metagenome]|uniref:Uncharacterized protein n=1 Tax=marine metagenome TaxID=408172 RepID=A0A382F558_9ZZZZ